MGDFDFTSGWNSLPSGLPTLSFDLATTLEVLTWSTLSSQQASLSRHLMRGTFSRSPSDFMRSPLTSLITPPMYLAPLSVVKWTTSSKNCLSGSSWRVIYWLKMNLLVLDGETSVVIVLLLTWMCILHGNLIFIVIAMMFKLYW